MLFRTEGFEQDNGGHRAEILQYQELTPFGSFLPFFLF
jgi:hypothetical protein